MTRDPDKKRFFDAVNHVESDEIPLFEVDADMAVVNRMMRRDYSMALHLFDLPAKDQVEVGRAMGNDMIYFAHVWRVGRKEWRDTDGRIHYIDGTVKTRAELDKLWLPDLDSIKRRLNQVVEEAEGTGLGVVYGSQSAPFTCAASMGFADFAIATLDDPGLVEEIEKRLHEYCLRELEMALSCRIDTVRLGSGLTMNTGPMLSPEMMERFEFSLMREQARMVKARDLPLELHIDGLIVDMIPDFLAMGVDILNPIDPCAGAQDIYEIKRVFGDRITVSGNIDINGVLLKGTPDEVRQDVVEHIDRLAVGGGYIVSSSHNLHELIPVENYLAMRDAVHTYTRRP
jgi:uroporphyrinogen-III decarboxylase